MAIDDPYRTRFFRRLCSQPAHLDRESRLGCDNLQHFGYDEGLAGHITVRDPEHTDRFWVNPLGVHFAHITSADLVIVSHDGKVIEGGRPVNAAAFAIHSAIHKRRPDVIAAAHAHSMHGRTCSTFGRLLDPITQDACAFYQDHALFDCYTGVVNETSEGDQIATALGAKKAAILKNHGLLTVGKSVDTAAWFFISMDRCCQSQLLAEMAGKPSLVPHDVAIKTRDFIASDLAAWASFQPLFQFITRKHPDLEMAELQRACLRRPRPQGGQQGIGLRRPFGKS